MVEGVQWGIDNCVLLCEQADKIMLTHNWTR